MEYIGNKDILKQNKIAFLCSQKCPAEVILRSYDWAKEQREQGNCIICGNHSQIEKDVFQILLKGKQPLILVLARAIKKRWEPEYLKAIVEDRLLIISPFTNNEKRITRDKAEIRNKLIVEVADKIIVGSITKGGQLEQIFKQTNKRIENI
ncbi:MAG: DNA-binding protein [Bacteroidetes bacterium]|nr:DNA-binding protein [Bacteroidota bacterium]